MRRPRHSAVIRLLACLFLLWIGVDLGAHGLLASDAPALASGSPTLRLQAEQGPAGPCDAADHCFCFCHGLSVGAVAPVRVADLALSGQTVTPLPTLVPQTDRRPLDLPPRFSA